MAVCVGGLEEEPGGEHTGFDRRSKNRGAALCEGVQDDLERNAVPRCAARRPVVSPVLFLSMSTRCAGLQLYFTWLMGEMSDFPFPMTSTAPARPNSGSRERLQ